MINKSKWVLAAVLLCSHLMMSCSSDDNPSAPDGETYQIDQKVTERRECHALKTIANDVLNLKFRQIVFEYTSVGPDMKTPVRLTGVISMNPAVYNKDVAPRGLMLYNEFTCAKHGERTSQNEIDDIGLYMNKYQNLIMVSADLYGWTLTEDKPQAYCCPEITSVETIDAWDAAMQILKDEGYAISGLPTFNVGYSSGGFSALAVQRYCDEKRPDIHWNLTSGGAAPFDLHSVYISNITSPTSGYACSFPLVVVAYKETYHMDFDYKDVFVEPLASNIQNWILSKDYGTWDINKLIAGGDEAKAKDCPVNLILTPDALNPQSTVGKKLAQKLRENSLCGEGQTWQPSTKTKYYIMHSAGDKYMDWHVGEEMANYLKGHGCNVETEFGDWGNHVDYGLFQHIGKTILLMEDCMPDKDAVRDQAIKDAIDKAKEYIKDKVYDMTGIPL
ncbi:hypothetical protein [Prevotella sp. E13-27]|uniref:hypothetical protein n=1 Tax=Prevotella sp. E13-27 TaxID=2938122 RepID=UPI00200A23EB|nr:hypothetical protein [Prevotella sp. E13-27]MCK8622554.1 hypothetical protein [Prevotella sp. E13-27]